MRLRDEFAEEALAETKLRVEALDGRGQVTVTSTQLLADSSTVRRRAVSPPKPRPPSFTLIDQAEASGAIDSETALLYRVYSLFADARLPAQYQGDDSGIPDSLYMAEVRERFPTLSPATQAAVQPFLIPPAYSNSWVNTKAGGALTILATQPSCESPSGKWVWVDSSNNYVRVWYRSDLSGDAETARKVAAEIDNTIWPKLAGLLPNNLPVSDFNQPCNGGDGRLDIFLTDLPAGKAGLTIPNSCNPTSAFIELTRAPTNEDIAHELFHAFQNSFPLKGCNQNHKDYKWWSESTAMWAEDFVYRGTTDKHLYAPSFLNVPEKSLDELSVPQHEYGAYLLPFFVHRSTGFADFVRAGWNNCASRPAIEAVDEALNGGFAKVWPQFAKDNWNQKPVDDYTQWDSLTAGAKKHPIKIRTSTGTAIWEIDYELPHLSASYHHILFSEEDSSIIFWNGVTHKLTLQSSECCGSGYVVEPFSGDEKKGARVQALIKLSGQNDWQVADWTERPFVKFCRDNLAERIDELLLIISNSDKDRERKLKPIALTPIVWASNMGCAKWQGTTTLTENLGDSTLTVSANATWTPSELQPEQPSTILYKAEGTQNWSVTGQCSGSGTVPIQSEFSALLTFNFIPPESTFSRAYTGTADDPGQDITVNCGRLGTREITLGWFSAPLLPLVPGLPGARFVRVKESGKVIDDSDTPPDTRQTFQWHFEAKREQ